MNLIDFHFLRPWWFMALLPLVLLWLLARRSKARSSWSAVCDPHLLPHILTGQDATSSRGLSIALLCAILLTLTALAGPTWEKLPQPVFRPQSALVILLDLSRSMDCPDLSPSRLSRARFKVADILKQRQEGQTALVVFAGDAFTVTPLTTDTKTIESLLNSLETEIMPTQGSRVDLAIAKGVELIEQAGMLQGDLLLIGDGFSDRRSIEAAEQAKASGIRLSVLAVGTKEGAPVTTADGFLQDSQGSIVIPKLNEAQLRDLARSGGGEYRLIRIDDQDIKTFLAAAEKRLRSAASVKAEQLTDRWRDQGAWLLLPLLPLAALAFRRGLLFALLLLLWTQSPVQALEIENLWQTPDQQAAAALQNGDPSVAAEKFDDPRWKAVAQYRAGQYQAAADGLKEQTDSPSIFNRGNALAQLGNYQQAIQAYAQIPEDDPVYPDALHNKQLLEKLLEQQQQQDQQSQQDRSQANNDQQKQANEHKQNDTDKQEDSSSEQQQATEQKQAPATEDQQRQSEMNRQQQADAKEGHEQQEQDARKEDAEMDQQANPTELSAEQTDQEPLEQNEQWLNQIPDDPGSLLQRKFLYQYRQRQTVDEEQPW